MSSSASMFVIGTKGQQITAPMRQAPSVIRRPSTKKLVLTSRNDDIQDRMQKFGKLFARQHCRPLQGSYPLSQPVTSVFSLKVGQFSISATTLYNIHASYANDTLIVYRPDRQTTESYTIPPGRYNDVGSIVAAINQAIPDQYLQFRWEEPWSRVTIEMSAAAEQGNECPGFLFAEQYGGLAELLGFSAMDAPFYRSDTCFYSILGQGQQASSPPKLWSFQYACLHVDDFLTNTTSDVANEILVSNVSNRMDLVFGYYQGSNSQDAMEVQTAAPKGFQHCLATVPLDMEDNTGQIRGGSISLHHNACTEGSGVDRSYTHQDADQYNNKALCKVMLSFTNEHGQLLIGPLTADFGVTLEVTSK